MISYYNTGSKECWDGRIDSDTNFDSFRFHQWVEPIDLNDPDLGPFESKLNFVFIGFKSDYGIDLNKGRVGASKGPLAIRQAMSNLPCSFTEDLRLYDGGDVYIEESIRLIDAQLELAKAVEKALDLGLFPIVLGGGHETALGNYLGQINYLKKQKDSNFTHGIVNFDAHFDFRPYTDQGSSGTMFRQIYDYNMENNMAYNYMVMGIQKSSNTIDLFNFAKESNTHYILAKEVENWDILSLFDKIDNYLRGIDNIYMTICTDVFSTPYAPGVSAPQPLGMNPEDAIMLMQYIASKDKVMAFDICEVSPRFDQDSATASLASVLIYAFITKKAKLKGIDR